MLIHEKPRSPERAPQSLNERPETRKKTDHPTTDVAVPLEPHWAALVDGATD
jgi:hypothetical protein